MSTFLFKPFGEMTEADYAEIGFKSGLEIHQQLLTEKKLFCRCPAGKYSEKYNAEILRHMRPTLSELGEYDGTALMEFKTKKEIIYQINHDTVCTYEMDDTPPFELNEQALDIALGIAMLYNCTMIDELHIARKQYLDGSIPTGFQRTTIVGIDGHIPYKNKEIRIIQLGLEEDACREVSDVGHIRTYLTDRLGTPLIETVTAPDMRTPHEAAEVAEICRRLVRSTAKVRTGIGTARQDVNVSVESGTRIEIKGVPRIRMIPLLTYNEAMRQWNLLRLRDELNRRGITEKTFDSRTVDVTKLLRKTHYFILQAAVARGMTINCVILPGFRDLLRWQTQTNTFFSREISDRVRVIACLTALPNIIHSDSPGETLTSTEWQTIKKAVHAGEDDTLVLVWGPEEDAKTGALEIGIRAREATRCVPSETRQALADGTNGFERILPGPHRMYPDTDLPPQPIAVEKLERIRSSLPDPVWIREKRYREWAVPADIVNELSTSPFASFFESLVEEWEIDPVLTAVVLVQFPKRLAGKNLKTRWLDEGSWKKIFEALKNNRLTKDAIYPLLEHSARKGHLDLEPFTPPATERELHDTIRKALKAIRRIKLFNPAKKRQIVMGLVMDILRGRVPGTVAGKAIDYYIQEMK